MKVIVTSQGKVYLTENNHILKAKENCGMTIGDFIGNKVNGTLNAPSTAIEPDFSGVTDLGGYALQYRFAGTQNIKNGAISFPDLTDVSEQYALNNFCRDNSTVTSISFPELTTITGNYAFSQAFNGCRLVSIIFPKLTSISANQCFYYTFSGNNTLTSVSFPELTTLSGSAALQYTFYNISNLTSISFPKLTTISGSVMNYTFSNNSGLTEVEFPELTTISSNYNNPPFSSTFSSCSYLTTVRFQKLSSIEITGSTTSGSSFTGCFGSCSRLTDIYFNGLTTSSFIGSTHQFTSMFNTSSMSTSGNCTIHFPSNLESTIQGLTGYPLFGATAGRLTLAYDLPATS